MPQAIPSFVINLDRRPDRMARIAEHLEGRGITFHRSPATDAAKVTAQWLDQITRRSGPLGVLGDGDRACTTSHMSAWRAFLDSDARFGLFLEDDAYLAEDTARLLADDDWVPGGVDVIKLEKFGEGESRVLLGPALAVPVPGRTLHRLMSRHVGGAAYILSRRAAEAGLALSGQLKVPVDHLWFNANVSTLARRFPPTVISPAMATQRAWGYNSDIAALGKAARPRGWRLRWRRLKRGYFEVNLLARQLWWLATGKGRLAGLAWAETPPGKVAEAGDKDDTGSQGGGG